MMWIYDPNRPKRKAHGFQLELDTRDKLEAIAEAIEGRWGPSAVVQMAINRMYEEEVVKKGKVGEPRQA